MNGMAPPTGDCLGAVLFVIDLAAGAAPRCGDGIVSAGEQCDDGNTANGDCCSSTCQLEANGAACTTDDNPCTADTCNGAGTCQHDAVTNGTACDDGNACTQSETCQGGTCGDGTTVTCAAQDQCHDAGTCDPQTGCSNPDKPNGTPCNDGDACTTTDTCQNGACTGSGAPTCTAQDQCHVAGTCDPQTGQCTNPAKGNGTPCDDGDLCTQTDTCQGGTCIGGDPFSCGLSTQCETAGTCDPATGTCSAPTRHRPNAMTTPSASRMTGHPERAQAACRP